jgi:hypothetical protein
LSKHFTSLYYGNVIIHVTSIHNIFFFFFFFRYIPLHILNGAFLFIIIPSLIYLIYNIRDAYGLRNELMFHLVSGAISYIIYFVIELVLPRWRNYIGSLMFAWLTFIVCHTISIVTPLIHSFNNKVYSLPASLKSSARGLKRSVSIKKSNQDNNISGDVKSKRYLMFEKVLEDSELFELYKSKQVNNYILLNFSHEIRNSHNINIYISFFF